VWCERTRILVPSYFGLLETNQKTQEFCNISTAFSHSSRLRLHLIRSAFLHFFSFAPSLLTDFGFPIFFTFSDVFLFLPTARPKKRKKNTKLFLSPQHYLFWHKTTSTKQYFLLGLPVSYQFFSLVTWKSKQVNVPARLDGVACREKMIRQLSVFVCSFFGFFPLSLGVSRVLCWKDKSNTKYDTLRREIRWTVFAIWFP